MSATLPLLTPKDLATDQEVRWCPGCGDFSDPGPDEEGPGRAGHAREKMVFVSGIGCSSRFPYYMNTYGFHTIHGRAPTFATGLKVARPDLQVWVITGDGDGLSIGGNHLLHAIRRNVDLKIILFNNEIYGLTKGQYSPTSRLGTRTKSSPTARSRTRCGRCRWRSAAEATFVARTLDVDINHLTETLARAAAHKGTAFVEIYQNCKIFNDGVFEYATDKSVKADNMLYLEHGKPLIFGKDRNKGIRLHGLDPEVVRSATASAGRPAHPRREGRRADAWPYLLSRMVYPELPRVHRRLPRRGAADLRRPLEARSPTPRPAGRGRASKTCSRVTKPGRS